MYGYLLDYPDHDTVQPRHAEAADTRRSDGLFATRYQTERQRVYDRAAHMADSGSYTHADVEDAKSEAALVRGEAQVSRARGDQLGWVRHMLRGGAAARFGYRSPAEMVASRLDMRRSTALELVYLAERLADHQIDSIRSGSVSYERALAETRLAEAGASGEVIEGSRDLDLEAVKRLLQAHRKMTRTDERAVFEGQFLSLQPSLDGSHVQVNGRLGALEADICRQGLDRRGERLVPAGEALPDAGQRRALALTTLCQDELDRTPHPARTTAERIREARRRRREPALMVVANQTLAETSAYEQGVAMLAGARVGPDTVDLVQCLGATEVITVAGHNIVHHGTTTSIRPSLRRAVLARDDGCTIDGCTSGYRLEVHHIVPRSQGGTHTEDNLTTLCWYHHHVAVHRRGMGIDPQSPPRRRRLLPARARTCGHQRPEPDPHTIAILRALHAPTNRAPP
ncbi:MAG: HNH endonuclease signature motif containing protein [bacterium]|nr:HNH endonuclease signature motif containing protein [bacterium]MDE0289805.1 HNH endonuclease signature motif containing protein [bacterium]MDE0439971.1 HNH endonuclease signature motif containing protein [bacterium]